MKHLQDRVGLRIDGILRLVNRKLVDTNVIFSNRNTNVTFVD